METKKVTPRLIGRDEQMAADFTVNWQRAKASLQVILDGYNEMGIAAIDDIDELQRLIDDPELLIYYKMTGGGANIKGHNKADLSVNGKAAMALLNKPKGYESVLQNVAMYRRGCITGYAEIGSNARVSFMSTEVCSMFSFQGGVLDYSDTVKAKIADKGNIYIRTARGQAIYRFMEGMCTAAFEEGIGINMMQGLGNTNAKQISMGAIEKLIQEHLRGFERSTGKPILVLTDLGKVRFDQE